MNTSYRFGHYILDAQARVLAEDGSPVIIGTRALDVLMVLVQHAPAIVSKEELLQSAWQGLVVEENNLEVQISTLRKLLGRDSVVTVHTRGYRLGLPVDARTAAVPQRTNIPLQRSALYGRAGDVERAKAALTAHRVLTLAGPGGIGKTRLAMEVARDLVPEYADGVWMVELAAIADERLVPRAAASTLGIVEHDERATLATIALSLQGKSLLLVLDNCEHLLPAAASLAETLLDKCAGLRVMATSREPLRIEGEFVHEVAPLTAPPAASTDLSSVSEFAAVKLFVDRASAARSPFALDETNVRMVASICARLDGIPLAIELAAACVRSQSLNDVEKRLAHKFELLVSGRRGALPRQQTLRGMIDWSYELLDADERYLFGRLSVFAGGWTLEAATKVCGDDADEWHVLRLMTSLVTKSVVVASQTAQGTRYRFLETIREYAQERLEASGEAAMRADRHLDYFTDLAENSEGSFYSAQQLAWFDRIEADHDNYRRALAWADGTRSSGSGLRLAGALWRFWATRGYVSEGRKHLAAALSRDDGTSDERWRALHGAGNLARSQGDCRDARASHEAALALAKTTGDKGGIAACLVSLGMIAREEMDPAAAREYFTRALSIHTDLDDPWGRAMSLSGLADVLQDEGDYDNGSKLQEQSLVLWRELGDRLNMAASLNALGRYAYDRGDYGIAREHLEQGLAVRRELGHRSGIAGSLNNLAILADYEGDPDRAEALLQECLAIQREVSDWRGVSWSLNNLGYTANKRGNRTAALRLFSESLEIQMRLGMRAWVALSFQGVAQLAADCDSPIVAATLMGAADRVRTDHNLRLNCRNRSEHEALTRRLRALLGDAVFDLAWKEGAEMPLDEAVSFARTRLSRQHVISSPPGAVG